MVWTFELLTVGWCFVIGTTISSFFIGLYLYIDGMVIDMKIKIISTATFASSKSAANKTFWTRIVNEMDYHNEIIEY